MEFQKERCYSALNAVELKHGDKVIVANSLYHLKKQVEEDVVADEIIYIATGTSDKRFRVGRSGKFALAYLVERGENCTNCRLCNGSIKDDPTGEDKKCFMVFPKKENYVNIHPYCLHLWYCEDAAIPDFEVEIPGIGKSI